MAVPRPLLALLAAAVLGCAGSSRAVPGAAAAADTVRLTILGTTDVHGRLGAGDVAAGEPAPEGLARVATLVDSIRAAEPHVLLLDSGDFLQGNALSAYFARVDTLFAATGGVHPAIAAMNALGYDASAIGNHEFDFGIPFLRRALAGADFPLLAANVVRAGTDEPAWPPYVMKDVGPVRVGIIGFTTPGVMVWDRAQVEGQVEVRDIVEAADRWLPRLQAEDPDVIVATIHSGLGPGSSYAQGLAPLEDATRSLAERHPEIAAILFGHTHRDTPQERIGGVVLAQAEKWGRRLAVVDLTLARDGGGWRLAGSSSRTIPTAAAPPSPRILAVVAPAEAAAEAHLSEPLAVSTGAWSAATARLEDTPIADLVQRVQLDATGAELSSTSVFDTGARIPAGPVTLADLAAVYPYENVLKAVRVSGRQLRAYLEESAAYFRRICGEGERPGAGGCVAAPPPAGAAGGAASERGPGRTEALAEPDVPGYSYDVLAGVDYALDLTRPVGSRVVGLEREGRPVADADTFTLAVNGYRQGGGGGFASLAGAPVVYDRQEDVRQLIAEWVRRRGTLSPADVFRPNWRLVPAEAVEPFLDEARRGAAAGLSSPAGSDAADACEAFRAAGPDSVVRLTVLTTNDFHGALEGKVYPWSEGRTVGGAATLAAAVAAARAENPGGTLLVDGGDLMQGTPISNLVQGRSVIDVYNAIRYDAAAIGNHEFDWGIDTLRARIAEARFPWLSANVVAAADGIRPAWVLPTALLERRGVRVGLIGLTTERTPAVTLPAHVADLAFLDLAAAASEAAAGLKAGGAEVIVVLAHAGGFFNPDSGLFDGEIVEAMRRMSPDTVDLVVSGHTHTLLDGEVNGIPLVQARSSGTALGTVELFVDARSRDVVCADVRVETLFADAVRPDSAVATIVEGYQAAIDTVTRRVVAEAAHRLTADRRRESVLGDLVADAHRAAAGTQVALVNSGSIRTEIDVGPVTWREAFEVQPFANILYRMELDGRTLEAALEHGVSGEHGLVQVSGVRFEVDGSAPRGARVRSLVLEDGTPVRPDSTYTVAVNNFLAQGGDGYTMLRDVPEVESTGMIDTDVFVEHLRSLPQPIRYEIKGRIRFLEEPPERGRRGG